MVILNNGSHLRVSSAITEDVGVVYGASMQKPLHANIEKQASMEMPPSRNLCLGSLIDGLKLGKCLSFIVQTLFINLLGCMAAKHRRPLSTTTP